MKSIYLFILVVSTTLSLKSQDYVLLENTTSFKKETSNLAEQTETLYSDFIQVKNISFISEPITTKGRFLFKREHLLKWEYTQPFNYIMIINGDRILINDEGNTNEIDISKSEMFKQINTIISNALLGKVLDDSRQFSNQVFENNENYKLIMIPTDKNLITFIHDVVVYFDKLTFIVDEIILNESGGDSTRIMFHNRKINVPINETEFTLN